MSCHDNASKMAADRKVKFFIVTLHSIVIILFIFMDELLQFHNQQYVLVGNGVYHVQYLVYVLRKHDVNLRCVMQVRWPRIEK